MKLRIVLPLFLFLPLIACSSQGPPAVPVPPPTPPAVALRIGLIPEHNLFGQMERYSKVANHILATSGIPIELKIFPRFEWVVDRFASEHLDGAFFNNFTYAEARLKHGVEPLVREVLLDNTSMYQALIVTRRDSGIRNVRGIWGKRFAFVDSASLDGHLFPLEYLRKGGISDPAKYLKETYFAGSHTDVLQDVLKGKADVGATKSSILRSVAEKDPSVLQKIRVIGRSENFPGRALSLRKGIDPSVRERLKAAFLSMHLDPEGKKVLEEFGALRFEETSPDEYERMTRYLESLRRESPGPATGDPGNRR